MTPPPILQYINSGIPLKSSLAYVRSIMDFIKKNLSHGGSSQPQAGQGRPADSGGLGGNVNNALGGGQAGEKNEDYLDKGVDYAQQHVLGQGPQNNESAAEQAKDEQISDAIRRGYKGISGKDFPIKDK